MNNMDFDLNLFCEDITNIYERLLKNNIVRKLGIINHDIFQDELSKLGEKYKLLAQKEYCGKVFIDIDTNKKMRSYRYSLL